MTHEFDLERFVSAQTGTYAQALIELRAGRKLTHWMWFIFPQHRLLGRSATAARYGLDGLAEAREYWRHELLAPRLVECCSAILNIKGRTAHDIFGSPDDIKLRSSMTIFRCAAGSEPCFSEVLRTYFDGVEDPATLSLITECQTVGTKPGT